MPLRHRATQRVKQRLFFGGSLLRFGGWTRGHSSGRNASRRRGIPAGEHRDQLNPDFQVAQQHDQLVVQHALGVQTRTEVTDRGRQLAEIVLQAWVCFAAIPRGGFDSFERGQHTVGIAARCGRRLRRR